MDTSTFLDKYASHPNYKAPTGNKLNAKSWQTEAPLRMFLNNLDSEVAEDPSKLIVYGGSGQAARDTDSVKKIVWVAPISVDMGIARQTLIHEAVHAAQACPTGRYELIGWSITLPNSVDRSIEGILYRSYSHKRFPVEREAFFMQSHPNAVPMIIAALKERCK